MAGLAEVMSEVRLPCHVLWMDTSFPEPTHLTTKKKTWQKKTKNALWAWHSSWGGRETQLWIMNYESSALCFWNVAKSRGSELRTAFFFIEDLLLLLLTELVLLVKVQNPPWFIYSCIFLSAVKFMWICFHVMPNTRWSSHLFRRWKGYPLWRVGWCLTSATLALWTVETRAKARSDGFSVPDYVSHTAALYGWHLHMMDPWFYFANHFSQICFAVYSGQASQRWQWQEGTPWMACRKYPISFLSLSGHRSLKLSWQCKMGNTWLYLFWTAI